MRGALPKHNPINMMGELRERGNMDAGPSDRRHARPGGQPRGDMIPARSSQANFRRLGCNYFIATPGRRSSTPPCGPPTRAVTRRLVGVAELIVTTSPFAKGGGRRVADRSIWLEGHRATPPAEALYLDTRYRSADPQPSERDLRGTVFEQGTIVDRRRHGSAGSATVTRISASCRRSPTFRSPSQAATA